MATTQLDTQNQWIQAQQAERAEGRRMLLPGVQELMGSEGYSPEEREAILSGSMEALESGFGAGEAQIARTGARTRNTAGVAANIRELSRERGRAKSTTARGLKKSFADEKQRRRTQGLQMMGNLYGIDTQLLANISGLPIGALGAHAQGISQTSFQLPGGFGYSG
jgi:hypothetical protein